MAPRLNLTVRPVLWMSIVLGLGLLGVGVSVLVFSLRGYPAAGPATTETVTATVTEPMPCAAPDAKDGVEYQRENRPQQATMDGCGHQKGARVTVEVLAGKPGLVRESGMAPAPPGSGFADRIYVVLLVIAGLGGGCYALLIAGDGRLLRDRKVRTGRAEAS